MSKFFGTSYTDEEIRMMNFLKRVRLFENLTDREIHHFLSDTYERLYTLDEVVFFSGDPSQALYIVKSGMVTLNIDVKGNFEKIHTLRAGNAFGDNSLLVNSKRIYSAIISTEQAELYIIPQGHLLEVMDNHKRIQSKIMTTYAQIYNDYTASLFRAYQKSMGFLDLHELYHGAK